MSARRIRRTKARSCTGKHRYPARHDAEAARRRIITQEGHQPPPRAVLRLQAHRGAWHAGHSSPADYRRAKRQWR